MLKNLKLRASNFKIKVGDIAYNKEKIKENVRLAENEGVNILLFPEFSLIGASFYDGYRNEDIVSNSKKALIELKEFSKGYDLLFTVGLVIKDGYKLYDTIFLLKDGKILATFTKDNFKAYEKHIFSDENIEFLKINGEYEKNYNKNMISIDGINIGVSVGENEDKIIADSLFIKNKGKAHIILNPASYIRYANSYKDIENKIKYLSKDTIYISTSSCLGESSTDFVYEGLNIIAVDGKIIKVSRNKAVDLVKSFDIDDEETNYFKNLDNDILSYDKYPYLPKEEDKKSFVEDIFAIVSIGLRQRMEAVGCKDLVLGLSGGLDSTMSLLFIVDTFKKMNLPLKNIHLYTMPAFGTSKRTKSNAYKLAESLNLKLNEIPIKDSVNMHLKDINHDGKTKDLAYENAQARERTQILFDIANMKNALVIGTGDKSEISQGFATYNGDHMSSYCLNASLSKTELRYIITYLKDELKNKNLREVLDDILKTPISPELKNEDDGKISQKTEDIIGPYELIDFFNYEFLNNTRIKEIYKRATVAFKDQYDDKTIKKWLKSFYKRLVRSQFKRSVSVDSPAISKLSFSPRTGYLLPSDLQADIFEESLEDL